ncbi:MAG: radical SAM protein [Elusimicrobia bacterium]|nr:radical SAM protein [Elusimicrobiota bacterium]
MRRADWPRAVAIGLERFLLKRTDPLVFALLITDRCNLDCFYCGSHNQGKAGFTFEQARGALESAYRRGHRLLVITGGEPMLWREGERTLRDVVDRAYGLGFLAVFIFTNGTLPLDIAGCHFYLTIDGPKAIHEKVRPNTYDRIMENVRRAEGSEVYASITISRMNADFIEDFAREVSAAGCFRGISFNFLTAAPEVVERTGIPLAERGPVLERLWELKRRGHRIMLSGAAKKALAENDWARPLPQIEFMTGERSFRCCRDVDDPAICALCGYSTCVELSQLMAFKPSAIIESLRFSLR